MTLVVEFVQFVITLVYNVQDQQKMIAHNVQTSLLPREPSLVHSAFVQINILTLPKINYANLAHLLVILARAIRINAPNVSVGRIECYQVNNVFANHPIMILAVLYVLSVMICV